MARITVVQLINTCPSHELMKIKWPVTAIGSTSHQYCPKGYVGAARRRCLAGQPFRQASESIFIQHQTFNAHQQYSGYWDEPDFTDCVEIQVSELHKQMRLVALGYGVTDIPSIVTEFYELVRNKFHLFQDEINENGRFLVGEGNAFLEAAKNVEVFLWKKSDLLSPAFWPLQAVEHLYALDTLLSMPFRFFQPEVS